MKKTDVSFLTNHLKEVNVVEPNDLGFAPVTFLYRRIALLFKTAPFLVVVPISLMGAGALVYLFGILAVRLVSLLQYGF